MLSNEPGYYRKGKYGIRTENLVLVVRDRTLSSKARTFLRFETLTLCPRDRRLVDVRHLSPDERQWVNEYHETVRARLEPLLEGTARRWLVRSTKPL